jgi:hypothetical protein
MNTFVAKASSPFRFFLKTAIPRRRRTSPRFVRQRNWTQDSRTSKSTRYQARLHTRAVSRNVDYACVRIIITHPQVIRNQSDFTLHKLSSDCSTPLHVGQGFNQLPSYIAELMGFHCREQQEKKITSKLIHFKLLLLLSLGPRKRKKWNAENIKESIGQSVKSSGLLVR